MKTAIGIVTYGNAQFTRLGLVEIIKRVKDWRETICLVTGKPGDTDTVDLARTYGTEIIRHQENKGFPASINDLYDWAWGEGRFDNLIMMGNDVVPFPGAIDALINQAATTDYELIAGSELDARSLVERYPDARQHFAGPNLLFTNFKARPWDLHKDNVRPPYVADGVIANVHNLCLFKRSVFDKLGYIDVNFFPAYFSDNDYCMRGVFEGLKSCALYHAEYFHFWSRTIHQGTDTDHSNRAFQLNEEYYRLKWGGTPTKEAWKV